MHDEEKKPKIKLFLMEKFGFRTYHKWNTSEFSDFIKKNKFNIVEQSIIKDGTLFECVLVCEKAEELIS